MARIDLSSARRSLTVRGASPRRASGLSSPERRYCSIFWRAPSIVYFSVYSRCFTSMISSISRRWYTRLPDRFLAGFRKRNWLSQYRSTRSEEHTSELQSQSNLVCRLLLEKKKDRWHPAVAGKIKRGGKVE